ncbi:D-2-hydroxyglutarate dehydrogenase YdiJ [Leclercia adecarboxylata]|uniref:D-2-hydroxyglutarate dehydrogenase YdiJ n=1 Tax=Leclercia adecarboxylata TaxID=83655 RepID=UPI00294986AB|nr:FAD-binding and (Fe-S)-binding domain-containing protein [Leclercia adecarboxylata]MDV5239074.1 FAD-binding and (Fe-S)-binding domain-containing protein [Leclercia adecarboxylata]MDV5275613.1 FAD-binding and (Fe-S)-binding domain-containing protein [Leclercia adecarboxylata]MDV5461803.1 FAD-binding and (Fe-S)-binding domain-containing protein [Leclercia adecarboxylata]MDV5503049.1 FAD-binding and (Fe-S)-binding domain-containing protein [Leclercia adecarboxylata]MDV5532580.1 FAD-binding and
MIPQISQAPGVVQLVLNFLQALEQQGFTGDTATRYADRLTMATDNSIYQLLPDAVVFPRSTADVALLARLASQERFASLIFTPRGGGTGTNGQALNTGIVVDMSRYMNRIIEINPEEGWVRVEAGVIKDQLNQYLKPFGYFFAPELSTSNRATLGGMINTDASGQGSLVYGKTSDHVLGVRAVLLGGDILDTQPVPVELAETLGKDKTTTGRIYRTVLESCRDNRQLIIDKFPKLNRFLTGYDLRHVFNDDLSQFDLTRILTGSEGTLAFITEARLDITRLPKVRRLVNVKYNSFDSALRNAPFMVDARALSVETVDSKVLNLAREDIVWHSVSELITDVPDKEMLGLNIVEFAGDDAELIESQVEALCQRLDELIARGEGGVIGWQVCNELAGIERIYAMRKKAVGLLGNAKGAAKPIPFAEDTCVPPENLADYIVEFRALLDSHGLSYGMFGHVDAGVLHVRPALDMCDPQQEILMKQISDEVVALTARYGGLLWGEHGKGFRAEYSPAFFGEALYDELRKIKAAFDPDNRLNPGKICPPMGVDAPMMQVDAVKRGTFDRQIPIAVRSSWRGAMECNGNGLCFNFDAKSPMCPSMKITSNRIHSPKGRATLVREWLRLLADRGVDQLALEKELPEKRASLRTLVERTRNSWHARKGEYDFSHEVKEAMSGCLACKACSTQCPIKIDVPEFRSRILQLYHSRYLRPVRDHLVATVESYAPLMARAPRTFNFFINQPLVRKLSEKHIGMIDLPLLSTPSLQRQLVGHRSANLTLEQLEALSDEQKAKTVLVVQDPFTSYYDAQVVADFIRLVERLGYQPVLLPFSPNGKAQHIKGFLNRFAKTAQKTSDFLSRVALLGMPMVGVDPALVLCYRDEYKQTLGDKRGEFHVMLVHEWLPTIVDGQAPQEISGESWYLFGHCTEVTALPGAPAQWASIFARFGAKLESVSVGCCGMAGTYGHEVVNHKNSLGIYELSWHQAMQRLPRNRCLATGYSCRSQVKRVEGSGVRHPLQALLEIMG